MVRGQRGHQSGGFVFPNHSGNREEGNETGIPDETKRPHLVSNKLMPDHEAGHESLGRCNERFFFLVPGAAGVASHFCDRMWT